MQDIDPLYDQRQHRRVLLNQWAQVNFDGHWHNCPVIDLSGGGACLGLLLQPQVGSTVLFRMRGVGMVRASVVHRTEQAFALQFYSQDYDTEALVDNLTLPANKALLKSLHRKREGSPEAAITPQEPIDEKLPPFEPDPDLISGGELLEPVPRNDPAGLRQTAGGEIDDSEAGEDGPARRHPMRARLVGHG